LPALENASPWNALPTKPSSMLSMNDQARRGANSIASEATALSSSERSGE